jgi:hypothetical protein
MTRRSNGTTPVVTAKTCGALAAVLLGCTSSNQGPPPSPDTGTADSSDSAASLPDAATCPAADNDSGCGQCEYKYCCTQLGECFVNSDCIALSQCEGACSVDAGLPGEAGTCTDECKAAHPEGQSKIDDGSNCVRQNCKTACGL